MTTVSGRRRAGARWSALRGVRVVVTRPANRAARLLELLATAGATPLLCPTASFAPLAAYDEVDRQLGRIASFDWIAWTSVHAVDAVVERADAIGARASLPLARHAAVGDATAAALRHAGLAPAFTATGGSATALGMELPATAGQRVLFPRSDIARRALPETLTARGVLVTEVVAYLTAEGPHPDTPQRVGAITSDDLVTVCSPSAARGFIDAWASAAHGARPQVVCLGDTSAAAVAERGWTPAGIAAAPTMEDLMDAMAQVRST